jgi:uncharacterized DUF497 family protein
VSFDEASSVFRDPLAFTDPDAGDDAGEVRFITIGLSAQGRLLFISHTETDDDCLRLISAREATRRERDEYEED